MSGKTILFLGVIASTAYLYFAVNNHQLSISDKISLKQTIEDTSKELEMPILEEKSNKNETINNNGERLSIPAFGFILIEESTQIAAVMSDEDKNGELALYIDTVCEKQECIKDIKYSDDTKSANWQKETIAIIKLLTDGSINNGSIFIDGNTLKVTGDISSQNKKEVLKNILKNANISVEDKTTFESKILVKESTPNPSVVKIREETETTIPKTVKSNSMTDADARVRAILEEFRKNK